MKLSIKNMYTKMFSQKIMDDYLLRLSSISSALQIASTIQAHARIILNPVI